MYFLYKQEDMTYEGLLSATREAETEWTESKVSARAKGANVKEHKEEETAELKSKIDSLTAILKSSTFRTNKPQGGGNVYPGKSAQKGGQGKRKSTPNTPLKGKGPGPGPGNSAAGQFKGSQKSIQYYNCGGWGHWWRECPSKGNFNWRELSRAQAPPAAVSTGPNKNKQ